MEEHNKIIEQLIELGYSKEISMRVIKMSEAKTVDEALSWIELIDENPDIVNSKLNTDNKTENANSTENISENASTDKNIESNKEQKPKLTPEEAQKKAIELQKKIREKKLQKEKEEEIEKEKKRIAMTKEIQKRKEQLEEYERKKYIENLEKERNEYKKEKQKQLELLKREYEAKFSMAYNPDSEKKLSIEDLGENQKRDEIAILFNNLKNKHKNNKTELISSLNILRKYFSNIKDNILEKKFQKIKKENKVFIEKIKIYEEMITIFLLVGFEDTGEFYVIKNYPNTYLLSSAIKFIDLVIKNLNS
ncbi:conserved Plasmodium protein, unknown function [Plasmodium vinckei petteri]|uniref:UBA domain-containing protein n=2 Tax=Plasmodium vinckei petteri TaxID=138298 RepID=A0A6V7SXK3_PLAVN|nr:conserved Plasmodium protein, unknown function [Plasmodium vinckei petteri]